jgi:pimeloyl-ACP methyl ester carboxylesterase
LRRASIYNLLLSIWLTYVPTVAALAADEKPDLKSLLETYFKTENRNDRAGLVRGIESAAGGSWKTVADALGDLDLWPAVEANTVVMESGSTRIEVRVPDDYDPTRRYPLVLALGVPKSEWFDSLGSSFIIAQPSDLEAFRFGASPQKASEPLNWLKELRRRYHVDTDRIYIYGHGTGGDAAFAYAVMHADVFAGVLIVDGTLDLSYRRELCALLLGNLRHTPLHLTWRRQELPEGEILGGREAWVALTNRFLVAFARDNGLPLTAHAYDETDPPDESAWSKLFEHVRPANPSRVVHRFRYPAQAHAWSVRLSGFDDGFWTGDQIDIVASKGVDASDFVRSVLDAKLGSLAVTVGHHTIDISSTMADTVELSLNASAIDFTKDVTVTLNGKRRHEGRLKPSIATLLDSAYVQWEFQHPACVRLRIGKKGRARNY